MNMTEEQDEKKCTTISIPTPLAEKIKKRIEGTGFTSVSTFITYVLSEVLSNSEKDNEEEFSKEDEERVKDRLRALGYLD